VCFVSFLEIIFIFSFFKAEDIREVSHSLSTKQQELTTLETNRKHQKDALRKLEEDLRGMLKNQIVVKFGNDM
jgi:septal ring factor EnvC (AmiA/AmiB activator)